MFIKNLRAKRQYRYIAPLITRTKYNGVNFAHREGITNIIAATRAQIFSQTLCRLSYHGLRTC